MSHNKFHPLIVRNGGSFCVYLPELNVSGEGKTLEEAYKQFEEQKNVLLNRAETYGLATISTEPNPSIRRGRLLQELSVFFIKIGTAVFAIVLAGVLLLPHIGAAIRSQINPLPEGRMKKIAIEIPERLNSKFEALSPDEQRELIHQWGKLWKNTAPFREIFRDSRK